LSTVVVIIATWGNSWVIWPIADLTLCTRFDTLATKTTKAFVTVDVIAQTDGPFAIDFFAYVDGILPCNARVY